ncbi:MAG TPA: TIGR01458 family HAD-type hydrolase [Solirubrobacterales bacterium]|nr:TIGR01458 family HAD-type hydrolase [Solirubrobacterales bacterium]
MPGSDPGSIGLLLDIDGVLHVGDDPVPGAIEALEELRSLSAGVLLVTNTTSKPRRAIVERLRRIGFAVEEDEVVTPARMAVRRCHERGHEAVMLMVPDALREDLAELDDAGEGQPVDAVVLGDLGPGFTEAALNSAFRALIDGAELIALQHNRYWRSAEGLVLDVGAYAAALEYAAGVEAVVVGKPSRRFFADALATLGVDEDRALMVGDDVEADVGGALAAGIRAVLVRTGKYREDAVRASAIAPTATIDSIADLPGMLRS